METGQNAPIGSTVERAALSSARIHIVRPGILSTYLIDCTLLLGLCLLFFWRDLTPVQADRREFAAGDFAYTFYASAYYAAERFHDGSLPLWTPHVYAGHPFLADSQSAVFYPPRLLTVLFSRGQGLPYQALEYEALWHFPLVAIGMYLLARRLTQSRAGALFAAVAFTFGGYLTGYPILQLAILEVVAWLPWTLLCLDIASAHHAAGARRRAVSWSLVAGLVLGLAWLAGHAQSALFVTYGAIAYGIYRMWPGPGRAQLSAWLAGTAHVGLAVVAAAGVAAVQLLPSAEFMRVTTRAGLSFEDAGTGFVPYDLLQLVLPAVGMPVPALYFGILPIGLALIALTIAHRSAPAGASHSRSAILFWGGAGLLALLLSFGKLLPVYHVAYLFLPGWGLFRHQERIVMWLAVALALLAGYAVAALGSGRRTAPEAVEGIVALVRQTARAYGWTALAALLLALAFFTGYQAGRESMAGFVSATLFLAGLLGLGALAIRSRHPGWLTALLVLDLFTLTAGNHTGPAGQDLFPAALLKVPRADRDMFRMANEAILPETYGNLYGLEDIGGASPLILARYRSLLDRLPAQQAWRLLNVKYVLTWREDIGGASERLATGNDPTGKPAYLYRLAQPAPRAWLPRQVHIEPDLDRLWQRLAAPGFDPLQEVVLEAQPADLAQGGACTGSVAWRTGTPERLALSVAAESPCMLVLSELDYPGWVATVDGRPAAIRRANGALRSIAVGAGQHQVALSYQPASLHWGALISALSLLAILLWLVGGQLARGKHVFRP